MISFRVGLAGRLMGLHSRVFGWRAYGTGSLKLSRTLRCIYMRAGRRWRGPIPRKPGGMTAEGCFVFGPGCAFSWICVVVWI